MTHPFEQLYMPQELACEFLAVFSRFEYALKSTAYALGGANHVTPDWDLFGRHIDERFRASSNEKIADAIDFLLKHSPRKQVLVDGRIRLRDCPPDRNLPQAVQVLLMVRRVRNNLFHGGKYLPDGETEAGRNECLVSCSMQVLKYCLDMVPEVRVSYEH